jgi:hypothetical protein
LPESGEVSAVSSPSIRRLGVGEEPPAMVLRYEVLTAGESNMVTKNTAADDDDVGWMWR